MEGLHFTFPNPEHQGTAFDFGKVETDLDVAFL
jgi:hypothetical protein